MISSRFDLGWTSKTLNFSLLRFNERFQNLGYNGEGKIKLWMFLFELSMVLIEL